MLVGKTWYGHWSMAESMVVENMSAPSGLSLRKGGQEGGHTFVGPGC